MKFTFPNILCVLLFIFSAVALSTLPLPTNPTFGETVLPFIGGAAGAVALVIVILNITLKKK